MKPLVITSIEDETGDRCVDILQLGEGAFAFRECRRDPEDTYGWRYLSMAAPTVFGSEAEARNAACRQVGWVQQ